MNELPERPKTTDRAQYRTVAIPYFEYDMLRRMAEEDHRSIGRQLGMYIQQLYTQRYKDDQGSGPCGRFFLCGTECREQRNGEAVV